MIPAITKTYGRGGEMGRKIEKRYDVSRAKCLKCGKVKSITFDAGERFRQTYCKVDGKVTIWERVNCADYPLGDDPTCENYFCGD